MNTLRWRSVLKALRPRQWLKNLLIFAPLIFGEKLFDGESFLQVTYAALLFSLASSAVYIFNDVVDRAIDATHPLKRFRPFASGALSPKFGYALSGVLMVSAVGLALITNDWLAGSLVLYALVQILYCFWLKHQPILDIGSIVVGFLIRVFVGAVVIDSQISHWLFLVTVFLAILMTALKRRAEFVRDGGVKRRVIAMYKQEFLDQIIAIASSSTLITYALYTLSLASADIMVWSTLPFIFIIFRILYLGLVLNRAEEPELLLFTDRTLLFLLVTYIALVVGVIYGNFI